MYQSGELKHKIGFDIDRHSWRNLTLFQKKLAQVKEQMSGIKTVNFKVNTSAVRQAVTKVEKVKAETTKRIQKQYGVGLEFGRAKGLDKTYAQFWEDALKAKERAAKKVLTKQRINTTGRLDSVFGYGGSGSARKTAFADMLREEDKAAKRSATMNSRIESARMRAEYRLNKAGFGSSQIEQFLSPTGGFGRAAAAFRNSGDVNVFSAAVTRATGSMVDNARAAKSMSQGMHDLRSTLVAATQAYTVFAGAQALATKGMDFESLRAGMKIYAGTDDGIAAEFQYIADQANRMGVNFDAAAKQYSKLSIVARDKLTSDQIKGLFEGVSEYATVLQVDAEQYKRAFNALQQMLSKTTIMSEELNFRLLTQ